MEDKTAGQLESALRVNEASAKAFEPKTSWSNCIFSCMPPFRELFCNKLCIQESLVRATICCTSVFYKLQNFWTYTYSPWMGSRLSIQLQYHGVYNSSSLSCSDLPEMESVRYRKLNILTTFKARSQNRFSTSGQDEWLVSSSWP